MDGQPRWVTAEEVAKAAGVSRSAVSRAFTAGASVAPATRARVMEVAARMGYAPSAVGRGLVASRTGLVGLVVAELTNPFYAALTAALAEELRAAGQAPLLLLAPAADRTDELLPSLAAWRVDGVIIASATLGSRMARLCAAARIPVVLLDRQSGTRPRGVREVASDNDAAGEAVARHLLARGHRRCAFVAGIEDTATSRAREAGFLRGLAAGGARLAGRACGQFTRAGGMAAARALLAGRRGPDAIFCANDEMALGVLDAARGEFGLRIPHDLSVVGFDDIAPAALEGYTLTTMRQDVRGLAAAAAAALREGAAPPRLLPCAWVERATVRALPTTPPARSRG